MVSSHPLHSTRPTTRATCMYMYTVNRNVARGTDTGAPCPSGSGALIIARIQIRQRESYLQAHRHYYRRSHLHFRRGPGVGAVRHFLGRYIFLHRTNGRNTTRPIGNIIYLLLLIIVGGGHRGRHPRWWDWYRFSSSSTCLMYGRGNASGRRYPASRSRPLCPYLHLASANNPKCRAVRPPEIKLRGSFFSTFPSIFPAD